MQDNIMDGQASPVAHLQYFNSITGLALIRTTTISTSVENLGCRFQFNFICKQDDLITKLPSFYKLVYI
jgi:hypothetical protein